MIGVSSSALNRWELGGAYPSEQVLALLTKALGVTISSRNAETSEFSPFHRGALLRALRIRSGVSLKEAAEEFGFSASAISRWENGQRDAGEHVVRLYVERFHPTEPEAQALKTGETQNPLGSGSAEHLPEFISRVRGLKFEGAFGALDLEFLAADAALSPKDIRSKMQLSDAYIEWLEWEYRHREAFQWAQWNLKQAHQTRDYDFVGRAVRVVAHQLITEYHKPDQGLEFLSQAVRFARGSASECMVTREAADRLAQTGRFSEAWATLQEVSDASLQVHHESRPTDCYFMKASIALASRQFSAVLKALSQTAHPDPYMQNFTVQMVAEAHHALGDRAKSVRVLENGIQLLDRPGLRHFSTGLIERVGIIAGEPYRPELWKWRRSWSPKPSLSTHT